jgi:hypothetical protein
VEPELAWAELDDACALAESYVRTVLGGLLSTHAHDLELLESLHAADHQRGTDGGGGGESFLRVDWVAVPETMRARRVNRRRRRRRRRETAAASAGGRGRRRRALAAAAVCVCARREAPCPVGDGRVLRADGCQVWEVVWRELGPAVPAKRRARRPYPRAAAPQNAWPGRYSEALQELAAAEARQPGRFAQVSAGGGVGAIYMPTQAHRLGRHRLRASPG